MDSSNAFLPGYLSLRKICTGQSRLVNSRCNDKPRSTSPGTKIQHLGRAARSKGALKLTDSAAVDVAYLENKLQRLQHVVAQETWKPRLFVYLNKAHMGQRLVTSYASIGFRGVTEGPLRTLPSGLNLRTVAWTIPTSFGGVPGHNAAEMGTDGRVTVESADAIPVHGYL